MAITEPIDLLAGFPGWTTDFDLMARQEQSRHASGRTRVKDFGSPIWQGSWSSKRLRPNELDEWRARLSFAEKSQMTFWGYALSRCRPINHPGSGVLPTGELHTIGDDNKTVRVDGLPGISLSIGDMIQIGGNLHRAAEPAVASSGLTPLFTIEPHLWPETVVGDNVAISRPACLMTIVPGSVSASADVATGRGTISFRAIEARG